MAGETRRGRRRVGRGSRGDHGQSEPENRARAGRRGDAQLTAVPANDTARQVQPEPGARDSAAARVPAAAKLLENARQVLRANAEASVGYLDEHVRAVA